MFEKIQHIHLIYNRKNTRVEEGLSRLLKELSAEHCPVEREEYWKNPDFSSVNIACAGLEAPTREDFLAGLRTFCGASNGENWMPSLPEMLDDPGLLFVDLYIGG